MIVTGAHIRFYDAAKLRAVHAAHYSSPNRTALASRYLADRPKHYSRRVPSVVRDVDVHGLIPTDPRHVRGADSDLGRNLAIFIANRLKRGDSSCMLAALQHFTIQHSGASPTGYVKLAHRWLRAYRRSA